MKVSPIQVTMLPNTGGSDISIVNAARVSFHKESDWDTSEDFTKLWAVSSKDQKLLKYLAEHNHWSPFSHSFLSFRVKAPIFVARQLVKHSVGGMWNEVSRRYVDEEPEFFFPTSWRKRAENVKQGSSEEEVTTKAFANFCDLPVFPEEVVALCLDLYADMIAKEIAPEQARMVLPQNTMTEWIWSGSLYYFARVYNERMAPGAQKECSDVLKQVGDCIASYGSFDVSWKVLTQ